jgi:hypothetical protein
MNRGLFIFLCVSSDEYFARNAHLAGPATGELIAFMRDCGSCSSWAWHAESQEALEMARLLIHFSASEPILIPAAQTRRARRQFRRAA